MPTRPPIAENNVEESDKNPAPQRFGINPPIVEPINRPAQIKVLGSINQMFYWFIMAKILKKCYKVIVIEVERESTSFQNCGIV